MFSWLGFQWQPRFKRNGGAQQIKDHSPSAGLAFSLTSKLIYPVVAVVAATAAPFTAIRKKQHLQASIVECGLQTSNSPGSLQVFSTRLGMLKLPASRTEQPPGSQPLRRNPSLVAVLTSADLINSPTCVCIYSVGCSSGDPNTPPLVSSLPAPNLGSKCSSGYSKTLPLLA